MHSYRVKEIMVPLSEYATVTEGTTLFQAVLALEKAQEEYDHTKYRHRAVLVLDANSRVIGKLGQMDVLHAIEIQPDERKFFQLQELQGFGFSHKTMRNIVDARRRRDLSLKELCKTVSSIKVEAIMQAPTEGEYITAEATLEMAIHQMVAGPHLSLLVAEGKEIVGILRLSDAFAAIFHAMKECESDQNEVGS